MASNQKAPAQGAQNQPKQPKPPKVDPYAHLPPFPASTSTRIYYARTVADADAAAACLTAGPLGFDIEWRPNYRAGMPDNRTALIQLAGRDFVLLAHVAAMHSFPEELRRVLEAPEIMKVGVGIQADAQKLYNDWRVAMRSCVDCGALAVTLDTVRWEAPPPPPQPEPEPSAPSEPPNSVDSLAKEEKVRLDKHGRPRPPKKPRDPNAPPPVHAPGLARLVGAYLQLRLDKPKKIQRSDWEQLLSPEQQTYAANDALAGREAYIALKHLSATLAKPDKLDPRAPQFFAFDCNGSFVVFLPIDAYDPDPALELLVSVPVAIPPPPTGSSHTPAQTAPYPAHALRSVLSVPLQSLPPSQSQSAWPTLNGVGAATGSQAQPTRGWGPRGGGAGSGANGFAQQRGSAPASQRGGPQRGSFQDHRGVPPHRGVRGQRGGPGPRGGNPSYRGGSSSRGGARQPDREEHTGASRGKPRRGPGRGRGHAHAVQS
ncbi:hypothetical protein AURDEDRAFT_114687 [Auricularia subglabra TFB-10046 SS5]|nr:hypothetical protein AURDEDRAFT_114687 [Auricularia subglabra TFB-10046 SS5]